jgi:hypothetical protein
MITWLHNLRRRGTAIRAMVLGIVVVVVFVLIGPVAGGLGGCVALAAAALAAALCLTGAIVALVASHLLQGPHHAMAGMLTGMAARMGIPLAFGLTIHLHGGSLAEAGLLNYLMVFYPVTLAVETFLVLPECRRSIPASLSSRAVSHGS